MAREKNARVVFWLTLCSSVSTLWHYCTYDASVFHASGKRT